MGAGGRGRRLRPLPFSTVQLRASPLTLGRFTASLPHEELLLWTLAQRLPKHLPILNDNEAV